MTSRSLLLPFLPFTANLNQVCIDTMMSAGGTNMDWALYNQRVLDRKARLGEMRHRINSSPAYAPVNDGTCAVEWCSMPGKYMNAGCSEGVLRCRLHWGVSCWGAWRGCACAGQREDQPGAKKGVRDKIKKLATLRSGKKLRETARRKELAEQVSVAQSQGAKVWVRAGAPSGCACNVVTGYVTHIILGRGGIVEGMYVHDGHEEVSVVFNGPEWTILHPSEVEHSAYDSPDDGSDDECLVSVDSNNNHSALQIEYCADVDGLIGEVATHAESSSDGGGSCTNQTVRRAVLDRKTRSGTVAGHNAALGQLCVPVMVDIDNGSMVDCVINDDENDNGGSITIICDAIGKYNSIPESNDGTQHELLEGDSSENSWQLQRNLECGNGVLGGGYNSDVSDGNGYNSGSRKGSDSSSTQGSEVLVFDGEEMRWVHDSLD